MPGLVISMWVTSILKNAEEAIDRVVALGEKYDFLQRYAGLGVRVEAGPGGSAQPFLCIYSTRGLTSQFWEHDQLEIMESLKRIGEYCQVKKVSVAAFCRAAHLKNVSYVKRGDRNSSKTISALER